MATPMSLYFSVPQSLRDHMGGQIYFLGSVVISCDWVHNYLERVRIQEPEQLVEAGS